MKITIKGTNFKLDNEIKSYVNEKIGELEKFVSEGTMMRVRVELERTTMHHQKGDIFRAEVNIKLPGKLLRAEAQRADVKLAIIEIKEEIRRELRDYKNKQQDLRRRGKRSIKKRLTLSELAWRKKDIFDRGL